MSGADIGLIVRILMYIVQNSAMPGMDVAAMGDALRGVVTEQTSLSGGFNPSAEYPDSIAPGHLLEFAENYQQTQVGRAQAAAHIASTAFEQSGALQNAFAALKLLNDSPVGMVGAIQGAAESNIYNGQVLTGIGAQIGSLLDIEKDRTVREAIGFKKGAEIAVGYYGEVTTEPADMTPDSYDDPFARN